MMMLGANEAPSLKVTKFLMMQLGPTVIGERSMRPSRPLRTDSSEGTPIARKSPRYAEGSTIKGAL